MSMRDGGAYCAAKAPPLFGVVPDHLDAESDFLFGVRNGLSLLARQKIGDRGDPLDNEISGAVQDAGARVRVHLRPSGQGALGRGDGEIDVGGVGQRRRPDPFAGRGVVDFEPPAALCRSPCAPDEQLALAHLQAPLSAPSGDATIRRSCDHSPGWRPLCRLYSG